MLPIENLLPFTPILTVLAMSLDYSVLRPNDGAGPLERNVNGVF